MDSSDNDSKVELATNEDSARCIENGQGNLQTFVGEEPHPDLEPSSQSNTSHSAREQARCDTYDIGDIPVEEFSVPMSETVVPGLRPQKEKPVCGVSGRRKSKAQSTREDEKTTCDIDAGAKLGPYATSYALEPDELPVRMPKLPFASRLAVDTNEGTQLLGDGGYQRWLDHRPFPMPPKEGEADVATVDKVQRSASQSRIQSRELLKKPGKITQDTNTDHLYPMGLETRLPPFPEAIKVPKATKDRSFLSGCGSMMIPVVNVAEMSDEDDEDSWAQENADSPRTITCGGTCRLDALVLLPGMARTRKQVPPQSAPSESAMSGLSDFVGKADDKVLSYILDAQKTSDSTKPQDKSSTRLAPGQPLPGQVPGFPLQL